MTIEQIKQRNEEARAKYLKRGFAPDGEKYSPIYVLKYFGLDTYLMVKDYLKDGSLFDATIEAEKGVSALENFMDSLVGNIQSDQRFELKELEKEAA
jgi:hypothetical protein